MAVGRSGSSRNIESPGAADSATATHTLRHRTYDLWVGDGEVGEVGQGGDGGQAGGVQELHLGGGRGIRILSEGGDLIFFGLKCFYVGVSLVMLSIHSLWI